MGRKFALVLTFMAVVALAVGLKREVPDAALKAVAWVIIAFILGESAIDAVASLKTSKEAPKPAGTGPGGRPAR